MARLAVAVLAQRYGPAVPAPVVAAATATPPPDPAAILRTARGHEVRHGRELIIHTAPSLGLWGPVARLTNGMSCQNGPLRTNTPGFANNYLVLRKTDHRLA